MGFLVTNQSIVFMKMVLRVFFNVFAIFFEQFLRFIELEPDANEGKCRGSKTQTNGDGAGDGAGAEGGPMPARRFPPRLGEPARRTTALASASRRRRGTTAVMAAASGEGCVKRNTHNCDHGTRSKRFPECLPMSTGYCQLQRVLVVAGIGEERSRSH